MKKVVIKENEKGLLFKNGKLQKLLEAGKYYTYGGRQIEILSLDTCLQSSGCKLDQLLMNEDIRKQVDVIEVADEEAALHFLDGRFSKVLPRGKYAFWNTVKKNEFIVVDISNPMINDTVPEYILSKIPPAYAYRVEVAPYEKGRLMVNKKFIKLLDPGTYYFWNTGANVEVDNVDTRLTVMNILGQEILTQDKVSLRVNLAVNYKVTDYVKIYTEIDNYEEHIHVAAQLALREFIGRNKFDDILEKKAEMSEFVLGKLKERENELYVSIMSADVKDIILPGEIRDIMNTVLMAEKRAQANVITRREEVASTRSLLNTAKLMDENKTLYKLKELEYLERIFENVNNISIQGGTDLVSALAGLLPKKEQ